MIQYQYKEGATGDNRLPIKVKIDGRISGEIRKVPGGYQYFPKASTRGGDVLPSVVAVQRSLSCDA